MAGELKSCPFCGSKVSIEKSYGGADEDYSDPDYFKIKCYDCFIEMEYESKKEVTEKWNTRHTIFKDPLVEEPRLGKMVLAQTIKEVLVLGMVISHKGKVLIEFIDGCEPISNIKKYAYIEGIW